jgi:hypothetical protein
MTSEMGEFYTALREEAKRRREKYGRPCPECVAKLPKTHPSILLPGRRCRIHGYVDPRPEIEGDVG